MKDRLPLDNFIVGTFRQTEFGNGFVRPRFDAHGDEPLPADIFIPAEQSRDVASGDTVVVEITFDPKRDSGKRRFKESKRRRSDSAEGEFNAPVGKIVEILERDTMRFVGTYDCDDNVAVVEVDGKLFRTPIYVGDPTACPARSGDKVVIDMVRFPTHTRYGEGVVVEVLGPHGTPELDTQLIIHQFGLPTEFPGDVIKAAQEQAAQFDDTILPDRYDATGETTLTIDPADARDFDDAVSLTKLECGHWRLGVHIADVAHFVQAGLPIDSEAKQRGTSVYLPDKVIPMLPEVISNSLASLQPDKVRFTKSVWIEMTEDGIPVDVEVKRSAIRSDARLNYDEVTEFLADPKPFRKKLAPDVFRLLSDMYELAMILRNRRLGRGALELTMPEIKLLLDDDGKVCGSKLVEHLPSNQIIEEFMLAANEAVASYLEGKGLLFLRRVHAMPSYRKMKQFSQFVKSLGVSTVSPDMLLESRFEIQALLERIKGRPEEAAINYALLRSMQKAVYSPAEDGHYALASSCYCHFTSPIRRYPDLTVHRLLDQLLFGKKPRNDARALFLLGEHCSQCERTAEAAERELIKLKLINYLATKIGTQMTGVVTGVERYGFFVQGEEIPAEGLVRIRSLEGRYYYDADSISLIGTRGPTFRLGDRVVIEIVDANPNTRRIDYRFVRLAPAVKKPKSKPVVVDDNEQDFDETGRPIRVRKSKTKRSNAKTQSKKKKTVKKTTKKKSPAKTVVKNPVKKAKKKVKRSEPQNQSRNRAGEPFF
ncbi:MAG: VacB/RNase II family 3'-5' exoribonuclease [Planctomycetaceae bacterium]|nr:VacB/RNase II family 3'-5' exoribonuclease [Planctomycetaceae bacterium]